MSDFTLTILGATGYTGRLCVAEAVRRQIPVRIAGRRPDAVEALAAEYADADVPVTWAVADAHDAEALRELAESSDVLLSAVGPYNDHGRPVVEAAIAAGTPYLDVTGELEFIGWVQQQSERAVAGSVTLAPAVGYDGVPGDCLAALAAQALDRPVVSARVAYSIQDGRISQGTARTTLGVLTKGGAVWRNGRVCQEPAGIEHWEAPFPSPPGVVDTISVPFPEVASVGRSIGADVVRSYAAVPAAGVIPSLAAPAQRLTSLLSTTPVWGLLERAVDRLPEGPSPERRAGTKTTVVAEVTGANGVTAVQWARINDPYGVTAVITVLAAERLASGDVGPGVVTPSQLFDPELLLAEIALERGPV